MGFEASYNDPVSNVLVSLWGGGFTKNRDAGKKLPSTDSAKRLTFNPLGMPNIFVGKRTYSKIFRVKT